MFKRLSADRLLKTILALFAGAPIVLLSANVRSAWYVLGGNSRAEQVVAASRQIFTALTNIRTDRSSTQRTAEAVKTAATSLGSQALRLRAQVDQFMARIRAA